MKQKWFYSVFIVSISVLLTVSEERLNRKFADMTFRVTVATAYYYIVFRDLEKYVIAMVWMVE